MIKPDSLRAHLTNAIANLPRDPDRLLIFIDEGTLCATFSPCLSYEWRYTLHVIFTEFSGDPDAIMIALLAWVHDHESTLLLNPEQQTAIQFEADILTNNSIDFAIKLPLRESVVVSVREGGGYDAKHIAEPALENAYTAKAWSVYGGSELLCQWGVRER